MYMSGAATGMALIADSLRSIQRGFRLGSSVCAVVAAGATQRRAVAYRAAASTSLTTAAATLDSALSSPSNNLLFLISSVWLIVLQNYCLLNL